MSWNIFSIFRKGGSKGDAQASAEGGNGGGKKRGKKGESFIERFVKMHGDGSWDLMAKEFGEDFDEKKALDIIFPIKTTDVKPLEGSEEGEKAADAAAEYATACDSANGNAMMPPNGQPALARRPRANTSREVSKAKQFSPLATYGINQKVMMHFVNRPFIGWNSCAIIAQHEIVNRACAIPAEDAIAPGYKCVCASMEHKHDEEGQHESNEARFLYDIKREADEMGINEACLQLDYKKNVFGVGIAIPRVDGADYEKPFNIDGIAKGSYHGFKVVDPYWMTYEFDVNSSLDPTSPDFYNPTYYVMPNGKKVHRSWLIRVVNAEIPDVLKPSYYFGGLPLTQMIYERIYAADKIANEAPMLAMTKRLLIADANIEQMISDPKHANVIMKMINYFRDNWAVFFKKPNSQVQQIDTALGEFDQLIMTQYQLVACIAQMPATKLLKVTPTGFQSTGEYEWKDYAQRLLSIQNNEYKPLLERHYELYLKSNYPDRKDLKVEVAFNPIDVPTKSEVADVDSRIANMLNTLVQGGIINISEAREVYIHEEGGLLAGISPKLPADLKAQAEAKAQQGGGGGMPPGMGGMGGGGMPPGMGGGGAPSPDGSQPPQGGAQGGEGSGLPEAPQSVDPKPFVDAVAKLKKLAGLNDDSQPAQGGEGQGGADAQGGGETQPNPPQP